MSLPSRRRLTLAALAHAPAAQSSLLAAGHDVRLCRAPVLANFGFGALISTRQQRWEATMAKRTTHRSSKGTKLYAVRDKKGRFKDIQTYKRAHGQDIKRKGKVEK
jgi:hypothetical protein